jgi:hypothetical protein
MSTFFIPPHRRFFYQRTTSPQNLRPCFSGKLEYWRCPYTIDKDETRLKSPQWEACARRVFVTLMLKGQHMTVPHSSAEVLLRALAPSFATLLECAAW